MSDRIQRVNQLIEEELSRIILKEMSFPKDVLVTLTRVETSVDLRQSTVFISVLPDRNAKEVLSSLKNEVFSLQKTIDRRLRMRPVPRINFVLEIKTRKAARIEELLEEIKKDEQHSA